MCEWGNSIVIDKSILKLPLGNYATPRWIENFGGIPVDSCIKDEIQALIESGVRTMGCCCGHFRSEYAECLIHKDSLELVKKLGYQSHPFRHHLEGFENRYIIYLKTPIKRKWLYVIRYKLLPIRNWVIAKVK